MSADRGDVYSLDTSGLIDGLERNYPPTAFPGLWQRVDDLIAEGRLLLSEEVVVEATKKDLAAKTWCDARDKSQFMVPTDAMIASLVKGILTDYPKLVKALANRNRADAFVIAVAMSKGAIVVTGEGPDGTDNRPKIPYICRQRKVVCIRFVELILREKWTFN
jgi:Domain of unknown function (DUF4411)